MVAPEYLVTCFKTPGCVAANYEMASYEAGPAEKCTPMSRLFSLERAQGSDAIVHGDLVAK